MLSVLIPVYNYDVRTLVQELHRQLCTASISFEVCLLDDGSTSHFSEINQTIAHLPHVTYTVETVNQGRTKVRDILAQKATYNWLLFLDADIAIKEHLIDNYLPYLNKHKGLVYGGICYDDFLPETAFSLRYTFGKQREEQKACRRNKFPYKTITSANMLIPKDVFLKANKELSHAYGLDYLFSAFLKEQQISVLHIDNEVIHLGLETNRVFIKKSEAAVTTLFHLNKNEQLQHSQISLLHAYKQLQRWYLRGIVATGFRVIKPFLLRNLKSAKPSLFLFDCYRLGFFCNLKYNN